MKQFSTREKSILSFIVAHRNNNSFVLANVFNEWFDKTGVSFDLKTGDVKYDFEKVNNVDEILGDENGIIEIALLIKYLEDNQYIYIIKGKKEEDDAPLSLGKNLSKATIIHSLPDEITNIIKRTLFRVFVAYDLIYIVQNNFQTAETQQLALAALQLKKSDEQQQLAQEQLTIAQQQLAEAQKQTKEVKKQTKSAQSQLKEAQKQTAETIKQTEESIKQTKAALDQTAEAREQTKAAQTQTDEAQKQTSKAFGALICSIVACIISFVVPLILSKCSHQEEKHEEVVNSINGVSSTIMQSTEQVSAQIDSVNTSEIYQIKQNDSIINVLNKNKAIQGKRK